MREPLKLIILVVLHKEIEYRRKLVGLQPSLMIDETKPFLGLQLLPSLKPRPDGQHKIILELSKHLERGYTLVTWNWDRILRELAAIRRLSLERHPRLSKTIDAAWAKIEAATDEDLIDLQSFARLPGGHIISLYAETATLSPEDKVARLNSRRGRASSLRLIKRQPPMAEQYWQQLELFVLDRPKREFARKAYTAWIRAGRPDPVASHDAVGEVAR